MQYILMNKNTEVLEFTYDEDEHNITSIDKIINLDYAPVGIVDYKTGISKKELNNWWKSRAIPASRSKIREILEEMHIDSSIELLEKCMGLSLSDQYWIKNKDSKVLWSDINFFENDFSSDMGKLLLREINYSTDLDLFSPDNSSDGNLKKKWIILNGERYLIKGGGVFNQEPFNEVIATALYKRILNSDEYVPYTLIKENGIYYSCCPNMINSSEELIPAYYIDRMDKLRGSDSLYKHYIDILNKLNIPKSQELVDKMLICDYILANFDRHYRNFGVIRNVDTLKYIKIAPIFDSGSSLWANKPNNRIGEDYKAKPFNSDAYKQISGIKNLEWLNLDKLVGFDEEVRNILRLNPDIDNERIDKIIIEINNRIEKIKELKEKLNC